eukprot:g14492.t1
MIALTVMAAAAGLALGNLIDRAESDLSGALTVQIIEANAEVRDAQAQRAAELLIADNAVTSVRVVPQEELAELLNPWIGETAASDGAIPIPALVDAELAGVATGEVTARLNAMLLEEIPTARVDAQSAWLRPVYDALSSLRYMALALIVLLALGSAAAVWLAARSAFSTHRQTIEIVHLLGGTDRQIAQIFQRTVAFDALIGGAVGLALGSLAADAVILRFVAGLFLIWIFGFVWFAASTPGPAGNVETDAIVVATGEAGRIQRGIEVLDKGLAKEMLVSGVNGDVTPEEFAVEFGVSRRQMNCCVDLGFDATDTRSNATEITQWAMAKKYKTLRLVTSDWHMRRAEAELTRLLPGSIVVVRDAVPTRFRISTMVVEYHKLLASEFAALTGL